MKLSIVETVTKEEFAFFVARCHSLRSVSLQLGLYEQGGKSLKRIKNRIEREGLNISHFQYAEKIEGISPYLKVPLPCKSFYCLKFLRNEKI